MTDKTTAEEIEQIRTINRLARGATFARGAGCAEGTPVTGGVLKLLPKEDAIKALTEEEAKAVWRFLRWEDGQPRCQKCGGTNVFSIPSNRWRCSDDRTDFSLTSGTVFASAKIQLRHLLLIISVAQYNNGERSLRRICTELGMNQKTFYVAFCKAQEAIMTGLNQKSSLVGYMTTKNSSSPRRKIRYELADHPRAALTYILPEKKCVECKTTKPSMQFIPKGGASSSWGLRVSVCKECTAKKSGDKIRENWELAKESPDPERISERTVQEILTRPRGINGNWLMTRSHWTAQDRRYLAALAAAKISADMAADALGRSPKSIAWRARDLMPNALIPKDWRALITPARTILQPRLLVYPYLPHTSRNHAISGAELTLEVSSIVSRAFPDFMRADICQTVLLAILEGKASLNDLRGSPDTLRLLVRAYRKDQESMPGSGVSTARNSLDAPRWSDDDQDSYSSTLPMGIINSLEW